MTGTFRETSGFTAPVTINSGDVVRAVAVARETCSGCSTANKLTSISGTTFAVGGAPTVASARAPPQPLSSSSDGTRLIRRPTFRALLFITDSNSRGCEQVRATTPTHDVRT